MEENDYQLVFLAQDGNEDAINLIYKKYKPIIIKKSKHAILHVPHHGIEINDIMQEGFIGLDEAIKKFSQDNDATFYTFANLCIDRQIMTYLRRATFGSKDKILNDAITLNENLEKVLKDDMNIELTLLGRDHDNYLIMEIRKYLTDFERLVFDMRLDDYTFEEIAKKLNRDVKAIYNTFQRIKLKIKKKIKIDD